MNKEKPIIHENKTPVQETYRVQESKTLLELVIEKSSRSRSAAKKLLTSKRVSVNGKMKTNATEMIEIGGIITVHRGAPALPFSHRLLEIIWENDDYIVVYKKRGLPTVNTAHKPNQETALSLLSSHYKMTNPDAKIFMINRHDKSTSGFVIFSKNIDAKELMIRSWSKLVSKQLFIACIEGSVQEKEFTLSTTSDRDENSIQKIISAKVIVDKSGSKGQLHIAQVDVVGARIFSLRKLFGDNNFGIFGDVRSKSNFVTEKDIALEQISLCFSLPKSGQRMSFDRPYPTHYFQLLKEEK